MRLKRKQLCGLDVHLLQEGFQRRPLFIHRQTTVLACSLQYARTYPASRLRIQGGRIAVDTISRSMPLNSSVCNHYTGSTAESSRARWHKPTNAADSGVRRPTIRDPLCGVNLHNLPAAIPRRWSGCLGPGGQGETRKSICEDPAGCGRAPPRTEDADPAETCFAVDKVVVIGGTERRIAQFGGEAGTATTRV